MSKILIKNTEEIAGYIDVFIIQRLPLVVFINNFSIYFHKFFQIIPIVFREFKSTIKKLLNIVLKFYNRTEVYNKINYLSFYTI